MRKFFIILLVVTILAAIGYAAYRLATQEQTTASETYFDAVPHDAGVIIDVRDFDTFYATVADNPLWMQLCRIAPIGRLNDEILQWQHLSKLDNRLRRHVLFSVHPVGKNDMHSIGFVPMTSNKEANELINSLKQQMNAFVTFHTREYDKATITEAAYTRSDSVADKIVFAAAEGYIIISRSTILLEAAIRQASNPHNLTHDNKFNDLLKTAGKTSAANLYLNYTQLPRAVRTLFNSEQMQKLAPVVNFAEWTELDLNLKQEALIFNGLTVSNSASDKWLATMKPQPPMPVSLTDAMPPTTYAFFWMGINQIDRYFDDYGNYLERSKDAAYQRAQTAIKDTYGIDLPTTFAEQFENEMARVFANVGSLTPDDMPFTVFRIKSTSAAVAMIESWQAQCAKNGDSHEQRTVYFDDKMSFTAYRLPFDVPGTLFGALFADKLEWCAVVDNYLLFGASSEHLKRYLHYTALHSSLQTDLTFGKLNNDVSSRCNLMFYCNPSMAGQLFKRLFNDDIFNDLENAKDVLSQVHAAVFQLSSNGEMWYNNIFVKLQTDEAMAGASGLQTSWESLLDTAIAFKPQLVQNHNTGETEIFVQDMAGSAYLINNIGRILWKISLPDAIISPVYQVDLYRNNKLQLLFNTKNNIYSIDRLGKMVEHFPIRLPSPAVGSVAVFDYENNRNYRFAVACENRKVYMFDKKGESVAGWSFAQSEHPVQTDIYHFRTGNKDFVAFADKYKVYILDRQGRTRVSPEANFPVARNTVIALYGNELVMSDTSGTPHFISLADGKIRTTVSGKFTADHYFDFVDIDGDKQPDFVFGSENTVISFNQNGKELLKIKTEEPITYRPAVYSFSTGDIRIGIVAPSKNRIYLYNNSGKLLPEFPLTGSTPFSIGRLDKASRNFNLFVGSSNNLLYNYPVK